jgi:enediyne polyketide synthase
MAEAGPGIWVSEMARGRVVLLFPGLATAPLSHTATLAAAQATLAALDRLGVEARAGVGYSLGELTGLAWAGSITFGEAARLAAHRADVLRAAPHRTAMARVLARPATAERLRTGTSLVVAAHEGPAQQVLAGPAAEIRALPRRAARLGAAVDVLDAACALHSPAVRPCEPPWRAVVGGSRFGDPRRRLISAVTGRDIPVSGDIRWVLTAQLTRPALLAEALALACADADLVVLAGPDPALATAAAACGRGRLPVLSAPLAQRAAPTPDAQAALFAAGATGCVTPPVERGEAGAGATVRSGYRGSLSRGQADAFARA